MQVTRAALDAAYTSYSTRFNAALESVTPTWNRVAMEAPSTTRENDYRWMRKLPKVREWLGDRVINNLAQEGYKIVNRGWENTVSVDRYDFEDDQLGVYNPMFDELGRTVAEYPDEMVWSLLPRGFTDLCYDGQPFFDTDHPVMAENGSEVSVSNHHIGSHPTWYLIDTTRMIRPFVYQPRQEPRFVRLDSPTDENVFMRKEFIYGVDFRSAAGYGLWQMAFASNRQLMVDNYAAARQAMTEMKGDNGRPLRLRASLLVVPPSLERAGLEMVRQSRGFSGADNVYYQTAELHVEPLLAA